MWQACSDDVLLSVCFGAVRSQPSQPEYQDLERGELPSVDDLEVAAAAAMACYEPPAASESEESSSEEESSSGEERSSDEESGSDEVRPAASRAPYPFSCLYKKSLSHELIEAIVNLCMYLEMGNQQLARKLEPISISLSLLTLYTKHKLEQLLPRQNLVFDVCVTARNSLKRCAGDRRRGWRACRASGPCQRPAAGGGQRGEAFLGSGCSGGHGCRRRC